MELLQSSVSLSEEGNRSFVWNMYKGLAAGKEQR